MSKHFPQDEFRQCGPEHRAVLRFLRWNLLSGSVQLSSVHTVKIRTSGGTTNPHCVRRWSLVFCSVVYRYLTKTWFRSNNFNLHSVNYINTIMWLLKIYLIAFFSVLFRSGGEHNQILSRGSEHDIVSEIQPLMFQPKSEIQGSFFLVMATTKLLKNDTREVTCNDCVVNIIWLEFEIFGRVDGWIRFLLGFIIILLVISILVDLDGDMIVLEWQCIR